MFKTTLSPLAKVSIALIVLTVSAGCSVLVENRYSVFGFDRLLTNSPEQAKLYSLTLLGSVAVGSAVTGGLFVWLMQRWRGRRKGSIPSECSFNAVATSCAREPAPSTN